MAKYEYDDPLYKKAAPDYVYRTFVGRNSLLHNLLSGLANQRSFAVIGGPKMGLSALIAQLLKDIKRSWQQKPHLPKLVPVYINLNPPRTKINDSWFVRRLWEALSDNLVNSYVRGNTTPIKVPKILFYKLKDPWQILDELSQELFSKFQGLAREHRYCLILDEADHLYTGALPQTLKELSLRLTQPKIYSPQSLLIAGGYLVYQHLNALKSVHTLNQPAEFKRLKQTAQDFNFLRQLIIGVFKESEALSLIPKHLKPLGEELLKQSGKQPYILERLIHYLLLEEQPENLRELPANVLRQTLNDAEPLFQTWLSYLDDSIAPHTHGRAIAHELLQTLLSKENTALDIHYLEKQMRLGSLTTTIHLLEYLGLTERILIANKPHLRTNFQLWRDWYARMRPF